MKQFSEIVASINENKKTVEIMPTGFHILDAHLDGGFLKKELIVLGAPTGKGKSLFGGTIFYNVARKGFRSAYFSLEISNEMIVSRLIGAKAHISPNQIMIKMLDDKQEAAKEKAEDTISAYEEFMFFYDDLYELGPIAKEILTNKYDFVVIDFLQNIMTKEADEYKRLSYIALYLQKLAKKANTCILALSQLSNEVSRNKKDDIVEYKGSGNIAIVCDLGFFIEKTDLQGYATLNLRKNRRGISGVKFSFTVDTPGGQITDSII